MTNQAIYDVDDAAYNWFMDTMGRKWKDFKSTLKKLYFSGELSDEELKEKHADRVNAADWDFLIDYWMTPECEVSTTEYGFVFFNIFLYIYMHASYILSQNRTGICKENRGKLRLNHASGSMSFACCDYELVPKTIHFLAFLDINVLHFQH